jgi:phosphatidylinositol-3-phosphatase
MRTHRTASAAFAVVASLVAASQVASAQLSSAAAPASAATYDKVMVIAEENEADSSVIGSAKAPYLNSLARTYGEATNMQAGYPTACPSLAAYLLITSGDRDNICDDKPPSSHHLSGNNIFNQVAAAGLQWRGYAESMPGNCSATNSENNVYLVRHAPAPYYTTEAKRCQSWDVPLGTTTAGALHNDLSTGLPAYSFVTPNACDDMHGAPSCKGGLVAEGDSWLATWLPKIIASKDFQSSRLLVVITWDEGTKESNHIATLVVGATIHAQKSNMLLTHCSTLRTTEDILGLAHLGCAGSATSYRTAFSM